MAAARCLARTALGRFSRGAAFDLDDVAAGALLELVSAGAGLSTSLIARAVRREARRYVRRVQAERRMRLELSVLGDPSDTAFAISTCDARRGNGAQPCEPCERQHRFADGSSVCRAGEQQRGDRIAGLAFSLADGTTVQGAQALAMSRAAFVRERRCAGRPQQVSNALRAVRALTRDELLLSFAGRPWREALARLAEEGVVITRDGLRSGQRAARLRHAGRSAHDHAKA